MAVAKKSTTNVLSLDTVTQQDIPAMLEVVSKQISKLKGTTGSNVTTDAALPGFGKIKDIKTVENLVKAHSMLTAKNNAYKASLKELDLKESKYPFKEGGHTYKEWDKDIKHRLNLVKNEQTLKKLEEAHAILKENLSQEAKLQSDLKKIQGMVVDMD
jgi:hypothetical protein